MTADGEIILCSFLAFCSFLVFQMIIFRRIHQNEALRWLFKLYCLTGAVLCFMTYQNETVAVGSFLLYSGLFVVYTFCIFSVVEASLTLRILSEIGSHPRTGMTRGMILHSYNTKIIVNRRIERFVTSGDLKVMKGRWYRTDRLTAFAIRERAVTCFRNLLQSQ